MEKGKKVGKHLFWDFSVKKLCKCSANPNTFHILLFHFDYNEVVYFYAQDIKMINSKKQDMPEILKQNQQTAS